MTALTILQGACAALNLPQPTSTVGSTDPRVLQMLALLRHELDNERSRHDWTGLITTDAPTLTATSAIATVTLPTDFKRFVPNGTIYHTTTLRPIIGPLSTLEWQQITLGTTPTSTLYWRRFGSTFKIAGATTGDTISYDYISSYPVQTAGGVAKAAFTADDDTSRLPENLAELGLIWRWLKANNLDYAEEMSNYERELERATTEDRGAIRLISTTAIGMTQDSQLNNFTITA